MTNSLAVYEQMDALQTAAQALYASGFFGDVKTQAQAMVKVMAGAEIGLPPFASMSGIHIVQGKPVLGANLIATLVKNDPRYNYRVKVASNDQCVLTWYEGNPGVNVGESSFTIQEANAAGLTGKDNWRKYPSDMLFARALTRGARRYAPGIFGGAPIYTPEEMGVDTDEEGHIVQGEVINVTPPQPSTPPADALLYEDGSFVANDPRTYAIYGDYVKAHDGKAPANKFNLQAWHNKQKNGNAQSAPAEAPTQGAQPVLAIDDPDAMKAASDTAAGLFD